jgi:Domain of unknown function (DUF4956)
MNQWFLQGDYGSGPTNYITLIIGLLLSFVCGHAIAWMYMFTHSGLSYSRSYVNTLITIPVIVSLVMTVLSNNLVVAFGLMAIFAMVRFRSILRDTLDTAYILTVIAIGMACGTSKFTSAVIGCLAALGLMLYFHVTAFGTRHRYNLILNVQWRGAGEELDGLRRLLGRHSRSVHCASERYSEMSGGVDLSYRLTLRDPNRSHDLVDEVKALQGVAAVSSMSATDDSEL